MTLLNADELAAITQALKLLTAATQQTGIRFDGPSDMHVTTPNGDFHCVRWTDDGGGQYALDLAQY